MLRNYQQQSHDIAIEWIRKNIDPALLELATGAGKSHLIAAIAETFYKISGDKYVLCLAPSAELVEQNHEKYAANGFKASIFSASAGQKCLRHPVVFGTPSTVKNRISRFGSQFGLVMIDEAAGITPTIQFIIEQMRQENPRLRVLGFDAAPYRLGEGYIYAMDEADKPTGNPEAYFTKKIFTVPARLLIERGYLTPPVIGNIGEHYDTINIELNSFGRASSSDIDRAFHGHGRKTSKIIADIVGQSRDRRGVMIFAQTVQHAEECMASLPPELSAIVTAKTKRKERREIIRKIKSQILKYVVNVGVLTKGFDAPHIDVIAILRLTESANLLQQIIGRGLRLFNGKKDCLILDYAENIDRHCPDGDIFNPEIKSRKKNGGNGIVNVKCPSCGSINEFAARKNDEGYEIDEEGYFVDLDKNRIQTDFGSMPGHHGRRCQSMIRSLVDGKYTQCEQRWTFKHCPHCDAENDIAARYCFECRGEIVDPNEKLRIEFKQFKRDPTNTQTDNIVNIDQIPTVTRRGHDALRVDFQTEYRRFSIWLTETKQKDWDTFNHASKAGIRTVTYKKDPDTGFYKVFGFNRPADAPREVNNNEIPTLA